jgi:hypothetical protein
MSHYARNHLQDDWATDAAADMQARVQNAEHEAGWFFDLATASQRAEFEASMRALLGTTGPRANRARDTARSRFRQSTTEARALLEASIDCLLDNGELSAELDEQWTTLIEHGSQLPVAAE